MLRYLFLFVFILLGSQAIGQNLTISGVVLSDSTGEPLEGVSVGIVGTNQHILTKADGKFSFTIRPDKEYNLAAKTLGYYQYSRRFEPGTAPSSLTIRLKPKPALVTSAAQINGKNRDHGMETLDPKNTALNPSLTGGLNTLLSPFIQSSNELSASYNVRGGNYDENLIYVNGIEIQRPQLARSGQQEGMNFVNPDLVGRLQFSNGGFGAKYGDKFSSVLDITYHVPDSFRAGINAGFMGGSVYLENVSANKKLSCIVGARYRTLSGLLSNTDTKGDYRPNYSDFQTSINYSFNSHWTLNYLGAFSRNVYNLVPQTRETSFGTIKEALLLKVYFDGQEKTDYASMTNGLSLTHWNTPHTLRIRFTGSQYWANEKEIVDVEGAYFLGQLDNDPGSKDFGKVAFNRGYGGFQSYGRNQLTAQVLSLQHTGYYQKNSDKPAIEWGVKVRNDRFNDKLYEWSMVDSAGISVPSRSDTVIYLESFTQSRNNLNFMRGEAFAEMKFEKDFTENIFTLIAGVRANYWDFNKELLISPRIQLSFKPDWNRDWLFRLSGGRYVQSPFYREMRQMDGSINQNIRAQQSWQAVLSGDRSFVAWDRNFRFVAEAWYKNYTYLIPYEVENVRIRYFGTNNAVGYAKGLDFRINGEFVQGLESWARLSFMSTKEDLLDDYYLNSNNDTIKPGYIRRPSDQRFSFSILFQDYLPRNPTYTVHLSLFLGGGLPIGPPDHYRYKDTFSIPPYRRVDIGFSKQFIGGKAKPIKNEGFLQQIEGLWVSLDVFNLLQIQNTISYTWIRDSYGRQYAVPNYLTNRQLNLKVTATFGKRIKPNPSATPGTP